MMDKKTLDEILNFLKVTYKLKSAVIFLDDGKTMATGVMVGSYRIGEELPAMALEASVKVNKKIEEHKKEKKAEMLAMLASILPDDMKADMPPEIREILDDIMASKQDGKADNSDKAKATVSDLMERMKKGKH